MEMHNVFVSYRHSAAIFARLIAGALKDLGFTPFIDKDDIGHTHFDKRIVEAIESAQHFVLIFSQGALDTCINSDDWVRLEIETALAAGKNIVIVRLENSGDLARQVLPDSLKSIATLNALTFSHDYYEGFIGRLAEYLAVSADKFKMKDTLPGKRNRYSSDSHDGTEGGLVVHPARHEDVKNLLSFLDTYFEDNADYEQVCSWIDVYPGTFTIVTASETSQIVGLFKMLPLNKAACELVEDESLTGTTIQAEHMVGQLDCAAGVWIGDLAVDGSKFQRGTILGDYILPGLIGTAFRGAIYARASKKEGYDLLMRYGFKLVNPKLAAMNTRPEQWRLFLNRVMKRQS